jgi:hypothetical protein
MSKINVYNAVMNSLKRYGLKDEFEKKVPKGKRIDVVCQTFSEHKIHNIKKEAVLSYIKKWLEKL